MTLPALITTLSFFLYPRNRRVHLQHPNRAVPCPDPTPCCLALITTLSFFFTQGIAVYIFSTQIKDFMGMGVPGHLPPDAVVPSEFMEKVRTRGEGRD